MINTLTWLDDLAQNNTFISAFSTIIYTVAVAIIGRLLLKFYNWGRMGRAEVVTHDQFAEYKKELRETLRGWKDDVTKACFDRMDSVLDEEIKKFKKMRDLETKMEQMMVRLEEKMKYFEEKSEKLTSMEDQIKTLENKIKNVQTSAGVSDNSSDTVRRRAD